MRIYSSGSRVWIQEVMLITISTALVLVALRMGCYAWSCYDPTSLEKSGSKELGTALRTEEGNVCTCVRRRWMLRVQSFYHHLPQGFMYPYKIYSGLKVVPIIRCC